MRALLLTGLAALLSVAMFGSVRPAYGAEAIIAIAGTKIDGRVPHRLAARFGALLPRALQRARFAVLDPRQVDVKLADRPELLGCATEGCLSGLAQELAVERLLWPRIAPVDGGMSIDLTLFAVTETEVRGMLRVAPTVSAKASCSPCDESHLEAAVNQAVGSLRQQITEREQEPAPPQLQPQQEPAPRPVAGAAGGAGGAGAAARPGGGLRVAKWVLGGAGLLAMAAGVALWAVDGRGTCTLKPGVLDACPQLLDTQGAGIGVFAGGAALLGTAAVLFAVDARRGRGRDEGPVVSLRADETRPVPGPALLLGLAGEF